MGFIPINNRSIIKVGDEEGGDGTFVADGETINLRALMEDKVPAGV